MLKRVEIKQKRPEDKYFEPGIELVVNDSSFSSLLTALSVMQRCTPIGYTLRIDISDFDGENDVVKDVVNIKEDDIIQF